MSEIGVSVGLLAVCALVRWIVSNLPPSSWPGFVSFCDRVCIVASIATTAYLLSAIFMFGAWLTSPAFPVGQRFVAVSLNGEPIISTKRWTKLPTLEVRRQPSDGALVIGGTAHCNWWGGEIVFGPFNFVVWGKVFQTATWCDAVDLENRFMRALLGARRWRAEDGFLVLENGADVLRFLRLPR